MSAVVTDDLTGDLALRQAAYDASQELFRASHDLTSPDVPSAQVPLSALTEEERQTLWTVLGDLLPLTVDLLDEAQRDALSRLLHRAGVRKVQEGDALLPYKRG